MITRSSEMQQQRWDNPPEGVWKINVDAAFWEREKRVHGAFVVRDDQGYDAVMLWLVLVLYSRFSVSRISCLRQTH